MLQEDEAQFRWRQQRLERAHYDAERAARQYHAVEPEHRLVARTLECQWEEALNAESQVHADYACFQAEQPACLSAVRWPRSFGQKLAKLKWSGKRTCRSKARENSIALLTAGIYAAPCDA